MNEMKPLISEKERIDDLQCQGLRIISNPDVFCFGIDAVLLANYAKAGKGKRCVDLGTGNGIIPILMSGKNVGVQYTGLEIQDKSFDLARRSVELNNLGETMTMVQGDIKEASKLLGSACYNVVTSNPPYMLSDHGLVNPDSCKAIARHEIMCTLEDVVREASKLLKPRGTFYMVHRPHRLVDIISTMRKYKIEPKEIIMVHPHIDEEANICLIQGVKCGKAFLKMKPPLVMYDSDGNYTEQMNRFISNDKR